VKVDDVTEQERETPTPVKNAPPPESERPPGGSPKRKFVIAAVVLALLVVALLVVRGLHHRREAAGPQRFGRDRGAFAARTAENGPVSVAVARAALGDIVVNVPALGTVTPLQVVTVKSQISGYLKRIDFTEGEQVRAGQLLAQIDPRPYQAALDQAKGNLARDSAQLAGAELDFRRYQSLIKQDAVSQQQLDDQKFLVTQYKGAVEADKAALAAASVNLTYCHIVSPITGRVGLRQVDAGNYVTPGDANGIVVVTQIEPISVIFPVAEDYIDGIQKRLASGAKLEVKAYDRTGTTLLATGRLLTLDNEIDPTTGTVKLRAQFANKDHVLFPNQFVNVNLIENVIEHQLVIPTAAVRRGAPNGVPSSFVFLVRPNHTVSVRVVKLGITEGNDVQVMSGLSAGDLVVTEGADRLRDGARVELPKQSG
jgi:membrane fusion protein, multidrug efflux system